MSLYQMQKFLFEINRDHRRAAAISRGSAPGFSDRYDLTAEERERDRSARHRITLCARRQRPVADALCGVPRHAVGRLHRRDALPASASTGRYAPGSTT